MNVQDVGQIEMSMIYKIFRATEWEGLRRDGQSAGSQLDRLDGFIHFSTADQVRETASKHFAGQDGLILVACDTERFSTFLKWEESRGGDKFPHVYRVMNRRDVAWSKPLPLVDGVHQFPDELE